MNFIDIPHNLFKTDEFSMYTLILETVTVGNVKFPNNDSLVELEVVNCRAASIAGLENLTGLYSMKIYYHYKYYRILQLDTSRHRRFYNITVITVIYPIYSYSSKASYIKAYFDNLLCQCIITNRPAVSLTTPMIWSLDVTLFNIMSIIYINYSDCCTNW